MTATTDRPDEEAAGASLTYYTHRFEAAADSARTFIRLRFEDDGCVVGIGELLAHLDVAGAGVTSDVGTVLNLISELWADPHIVRVLGDSIDFYWNEAGDRPRKHRQGLGLRSYLLDRDGLR